MYISIAELRALSERKSIDLTEYSDSELTTLIMGAQTEIEQYTGRIFEYREVVEDINLTCISGRSFKLRYYPILPVYPADYPTNGPHITHLYIDGTERTDYKLRPDYGDIVMDYSLDSTTDNNVKAVYTVVPYFSFDEAGKVDVNSDIVHPTIKRLIGDMILGYTESETSGQKVQAYKDGDFQVQFFKINEWDSVLDRFKRPIMEIF
jgi:hypothetical protein